MPKQNNFELFSSRSQNLAGSIRVPGDKSISHRALMLASIAIGKSTITGLLQSQDVMHTAQAMAALGANVELHKGENWVVNGCGVGGFAEPAAIIDFGNSGTGVRLCAGLVATTPIKVGFTGDSSLRSRPMNRITTPLRQFGCQIDTLEGGLLPMRIIGPQMANPITYTLPVASAQVKSAVLLAGLNAPGRTTVIEPVATRDHTEKMLKAFGARISVVETKAGREISVEGQNELTACDVNVPGDPSSAAFLIVAALITKNSKIEITNILLNPTRTGLIDVLKKMGGDISIENRRQSGGEDIGDIVVRSSSLQAITVAAEVAPSMIDEYPVLAIAASFAQGTSRFEGVGELRVKECDRLDFVERGLAENGIKVKTGPDWMEVTGSPDVKGGGHVKTGLDHRIAMSFLVLGLATQNPVSVDDGEIINTSFPGFVELMNGLGAAIASKGTVQ